MSILKFTVYALLDFIANVPNLGENYHHCTSSSSFFFKIWF